MNEYIDFLWWIAAFEIPAIALLLWMVCKNRKEIQAEIDELHESTTQAIRDDRERLSAYKLEVAKQYVSIAYMKDVERRLTGHLVRIENKIERGAAE